jgi:hypothetical protein
MNGLSRQSLRSFLAMMEEGMFMSLRAIENGVAIHLLVIADLSAITLNKITYP